MESTEALAPADARMTSCFELARRRSSSGCCSVNPKGLGGREPRCVARCRMSRSSAFRTAARYALATRPWTVRWSIDGRQRSKTYRTKAEADRLRALLLVAKQDGETFDAGTRCARVMAPTGSRHPLQCLGNALARRQWPEWQPRANGRTAGPRATRAAARRARRAIAAVGLREHLTGTLVPGDAFGDTKSAAWLDRHTLTLGQLTWEILSEVDGRLGLGDAAKRWRRRPQVGSARSLTRAFAERWNLRF
jgi:hypothetical protein